MADSAEGIFAGFEVSKKCTDLLDRFSAESQFSWKMMRHLIDQRLHIPFHPPRLSRRKIGGQIGDPRYAVGMPRSWIRNTN